MTPADQHYADRRAEPREPQAPNDLDYESAVIGVISKILLVLSLALMALTTYSLM